MERGSRNYEIAVFSIAALLLMIDKVRNQAFVPEKEVSCAGSRVGWLGPIPPAIPHVLVHSYDSLREAEIRKFRNVNFFLFGMRVLDTPDATGEHDVVWTTRHIDGMELSMSRSSSLGAHAAPEVGNSNMGPPSQQVAQQ